MSFLIASPEMVSAAATELASVGSTITGANSATAAATTEVIPAALDEVSAGIAAIFAEHGRVYQALGAQAAAFHDRFVRALNAGASAYAGAEANAAHALGGAVPGTVQALAASTPGSLLQQLETAQIDFNTNLVNSELTFNKALVANEVAWEKAIFGTDSALNGVINRGFNVANLLVGTGQQTINTLVGAPVPTNFTSTLLLGGSAQVFNDGQIGGPLGAFDQSLVLGADLAGLVVSGPPAQAVLSVLPEPTRAMVLHAPGELLQQLETAQINYNSGLVSNELSFNHALLANEVAWEKAIFGTDSALNGVVNRSFNVVNLLVGTGELALNGLSGAQVPQPAFTQSLLTGSSAQVFNGGQIGGLVGVFDQSLLVGADLVGLITGQA
ncbi:PE family protein [Mycobacterium shinjukuense]|uniref:Uncharacterized protein n=1 Tax=Mycobacterium shinjukuense TaxID=398694 RepID=A0A7I7MJF6_9MYCO|nr:PE family protein [Mycobacterium shinjukuense]MCV6985527.1 PE family protein [Mycobacterium shinjukuense]ORB64899.1 hypothetical protein BST45_15775 [Mycobacterium shinjukuense]BBX72471.1 hypothetical protein MSHI_03770 [Mycobacterium shinjukuense]